MQQRGYGHGYGQQMSPEQMQQMQQIQAKYAEDMYDLRSNLFAKQQELAAAMAADEVNTSRVRSLVSEINQLRGELFSTRVEMKMEMRQQGLMPGYGMGHGMMHGRGMGPGMMGSGMMHGRGMGSGMMGPGMMYGCPYRNY
jgi:ribosomal protein L29